MKEQPQEQNPEQPTPATDPQACEIAGNVFEGLKSAFAPDEEDRQKLREDKVRKNALREGESPVGPTE